MATIAGLLALGAMATLSLSLASRIERADGVWWIRSAPTPAGWPEPGPVGEVVLKRLPATREAAVSGDGERSMFMALFRHIQREQIAMTAPVRMEYGLRPESGQTSMSFLYGSTGIGQTGADGAVAVRDVASGTFASVGVRGAYTDANFRAGLELVEGWLHQQADAWRASGPPRYLGYNSPFVPWLLRYGEVQVPVEPVPVAPVPASSWVTSGAGVR